MFEHVWKGLEQSNFPSLNDSDVFFVAENTGDDEEDDDQGNQDWLFDLQDPDGRPASISTLSMLLLLGSLRL